MNPLLASVVFPFVSLSLPSAAESPAVPPAALVPVPARKDKAQEKAQKDIEGLMRTEKEMLLVSDSQAVAVYSIGVRWKEMQPDVLNRRIRETLAVLNRGELNQFEVSKISTVHADGVILFTVLFVK